MLILASNSPRRRELLHQIGIDDFAIDPAKGEETAPEGLTPGELVEHLALQKALEVAARHETDLILAADTVVTVGGKVMGKPADEADAVRMLQALSDRQSQVYTGVALCKGGRTVVGHECTQVFFREMSQKEIEWYVADGEPLDKAGAYGIQGKGARFIRRIEGDYGNVVGLPLCRVVTMMEEFL